MFGWFIILVVLGVLVYIRLAPHDADRWHQVSSHEGVEPLKMESGYVWRAVLDGDEAQTLTKLDQLAMATDRTTRLAGSVAEGKVTYVTRSRVMGFPDYSTISVGDAEGRRYLEINSRLRFGRSDLGVNRARIKGWLDAL